MRLSHKDFAVDKLFHFLISTQLKWYKNHTTSFYLLWADLYQDPVKKKKKISTVFTAYTQVWDIN